jgi:hypothetical protein
MVRAIAPSPALATMATVISEIISPVNISIPFFDKAGDDRTSGWAKCHKMMLVIYCKIRRQTAHVKKDAGRFMQLFQSKKGVINRSFLFWGPAGKNEDRSARRISFFSKRLHFRFKKYKNKWQDAC